MSADHKSAVQDAIKDVRAVLDSDSEDLEEIKGKLEGLQKAQAELAQAAYSNADSGSSDGGAGEDAEFSEKKDDKEKK